MRKIKVLHINCDYMGSNPVHRTMLKTLSSFNIDNIVYVPTYKKIIISAKNIVADQCFRKIDRVSFFWKQRKIKRSIVSRIDFEGIDCIHAYTLFTDGNIAYHINKKQKIPYIVAIRDTDINTFLKYKPYLKPLARKILKNSSRILFLSESYKNKISELLYANKYPYGAKTIIIPNGLDVFWLNHVSKPKKLVPNSIKILYVGKINKRKNLLTTSRAIDILRKHGKRAEYNIVGKIEDEKIFNTLVEKDEVSYLGEKTKEELISIYKNNDIFVMPSTTETFGVVYAEAMSQGLPVIYSKNQGFDKQFKDGLVGYSTPSNDADKLANNIEKIIKNYSFISKNCSKLCKKFDWKLICKEYLDIYHDISPTFNSGQTIQAKGHYV